jgi:tryptophanase
METKASSYSSSPLPIFQPKTVFEPFRVKSVEPIRHSTRAQRQEALQRANYNPFLLHANDVMIDLLTDSGTGAMSKQQWAGMMLGDESYAGSDSFYHLEAAVRHLTGFHHVLPTHQGRAAERILFGSLLQPGDVVLNNTHFDTTRANVEYRKAVAKDILIEEGRHPQSMHPFKGNIDLTALEQELCLASSSTSSSSPDTTTSIPTTTTPHSRIPLVMITVTNNSGGGQPVSMANIRAASELCHRYGTLLFLDACRFAENAYFIKLREAGYENKTPLEIAQEMFRYADGCTMSAKKDGLANIGGFLALHDDTLAQKAKNALILSEGYVTYGGLAGYDMEAIAVGLQEVVQEEYLAYRIQSTSYLGNLLTQHGIPIVQPPGGHAIYVDAKAMLPHIPVTEYPAWALSLILYVEGGVRSVEIGSVMFGQPQPDGGEVPAPNELGECVVLGCGGVLSESRRGVLPQNCSLSLIRWLPPSLEMIDCHFKNQKHYRVVRLAFPRRVYTQSHVDYLAEVFAYIHTIKDRIRGVKMIESPTVLRHFTAKFLPVEDSLVVLE